MIYVLKNILKQEVVKLWHKERDLQNSDFIVLPGGFSFGDYLRSGAIARFSPIMEEVIKYANKGGYLLGICNGFQILCEAGLLDGVLLHNDNQKFICKNVYIKAETNNSIITSSLDINKALCIPIAHGEGRFYAKNDVIQQLNDEDRVLFRYCNKDAQVVEIANPNGSLENIAGICNKGRNVFGMMPHPERAADPTLNNTDGRKLFESILNSINI
jgi:phosphoribosylformylglycinamidine synthase